MKIDNNLLDVVSSKAKADDHIRMNYNFHDSLNYKAQQLFNALEPETNAYGVYNPNIQWHTLEVKESCTMIFALKDGPYTPLNKEDIL